MPRMRTIKAAVKYFKEQDPETAISEHFIRTEIKTGRLSGIIMAGSKHLIDIDRLEQYLSEGSGRIKDDENKNSTEYGRIRKINVNV